MSASKKLHNANAVLMSPHWPENSRVTPSYGPNTPPPPPPDPERNGRSYPPERPYLGPQGHIGPQTRFTVPALSVRSNLVVNGSEPVFDQLFARRPHGARTARAQRLMRPMRTELLTLEGLRCLGGLFISFRSPFGCFHFFVFRPEFL